MSELIRLEDGGTAGSAADTGSAMHFAASAFHGPAERDVRMAVAAMRTASERFPLADMDQAERLFRAYAADPRNDVQLVLLEHHLEPFPLPPTSWDTTGEEVWLIGTLDQVRRDDRGRLVVWDIKTGSPDGPEMLNAAALQLASYQYGASRFLGEPVTGAGIIRVKDYLRTDRYQRPKPGPVFWQAPWEYHQLEAMMLQVRSVVAEVRAGRVRVSPGEEVCRWCVGLANCLTRSLKQP